MTFVDKRLSKEEGERILAELKAEGFDYKDVSTSACAVLNDAEPLLQRVAEDIAETMASEFDEVLRLPTCVLALKFIEWRNKKPKVIGIKGFRRWLKWYRAMPGMIRIESTFPKFSYDYDGGKCMVTQEYNIVYDEER